MNAAKFSLHLCFCVNIIDKSLLHLFLSEDAAILGGYGAAGLILDAPDRHAEVFGFDQNSDILGLQRFFKFICNLKSQTLLHLRAAGVVIHNSVDFREADDLPGANIGDMGFPQERQKMMLTKRGYVDIFLNKIGRASCRERVSISELSA